MIQHRLIVTKGVSQHRHALRGGDAPDRIDASHAAALLDLRCFKLGNQGFAVGHVESLSR